MRESRLFKILYHLLGNGKTSASQLAAALEVSVRTIYRDIDALSGAGIPIYTTLGRDGGIQLLNQHILSQTFLSAEEQEKLLLALKSVATTSPTATDTTLLKLQALFQIPAQDWLEIDFSTWQFNNADSEKFDDLKTAICTRTEISFNYVNNHGQQQPRIVHPVKLLFKSNAWYLQAFCTQRQAFRFFKLNRIKTLKTTQNFFDRLERPPVQKPPQPERILLRLQFSKEILYRVYDEFHLAEIALQTDGSALVTTHLPNTAWLLRYLLSYGSQLKILAPPNVQTAFVNEVKKSLAHYE